MDLRKFKRVDRVTAGVMSAQNPDTLSRLSPLRDRELEEDKIEEIAPTLAVEDLEVTGTFTHSGSGFGVNGRPPVPAQGPFTQTYSTASTTHANPTASALTDATTGAVDGTVADVGGAFNQATLNNNFAEGVDRINKLIADLANVKQVLNGVIDALQLEGPLA
jgi:hypothetical protein